MKRLNELRNENGPADSFQSGSRTNEIRREEMRNNFFSTLNSKLSIHKGFTLIELLLVIAVLGVLAAGLVILINPLAQFQRTRDTQRKNDLAQIQRALEQYYNDFGKYPAYTTTGTLYIMQDESSVTHDWGTSWNPYINVIPKDPTSTQKYIYSTANNRQTYRLYAHLERISDPMACNTTGLDCPSVPAANLCGSSIKCNYGVTSSDSSP